MSTDDEHDSAGERQSQMLHDGGLQFGEPADADRWGWQGAHPPIICPAPKLRTGIRNRVACPFCGQRGVRLADPEAVERAARDYQRGDQLAMAVIEALCQIRDIFRRRPVSMETTNARIEARAFTEEWDNHRKRQCPQCSVAAGRRQWGAVCADGAELRARVIQAKAEVARQVELDRHPSPDQQELF